MDTRLRTCSLNAINAPQQPCYSGTCAGFLQPPGCRPQAHHITHQVTQLTIAGRAPRRFVAADDFAVQRVALLYSAGLFCRPED